MSSQVPDKLYKYLPVAACAKVLQAQALRWSAPRCFADPFEMDDAAPLPFDAQALLGATIKLTSSMIFAPEQPKGDSPLVNAIRRWREDGRFASAEEAQPVLRDLLGKMVMSRKEQLDLAHRQWQDHARNLRICCFSSKADLIPAWQQYADQHRGIALRFATSAGPFAEAQAISYQHQLPQLTSVREQLAAIVHNRKDSMTEHFGEHNLVKSSDYKAEREWRCMKSAAVKVAADQQDCSHWLEAVAFAPEQLTGIYFGLACSEHDRKQITELAKAHAPKAKLYGATMPSNQYALEFERVV